MKEYPIRHGCLFAALLLAVFFFCACGRKAEVEEALPEVSSEENPEEESEGAKEPPALVIDVCGAVMNPGVYTLPSASRVTDAVEAAGGFLPEADLTYHNRARLLSDGEQIRVPTKEETAQGMVPTAEGAGTAVSGPANDGTVNLNTAGADDLMTLPGIGSSKAQSILAYREAHGAFSAPEDLMNVDGIKEGTFSKIKDRVTVR